MNKFMKFSLIAVLSILMFACQDIPNNQKSDSGLTKATVVGVKTDKDGHSVEQNNIAKRILKDNEVGAVKHAYIISAYTGDILEYSTVVGKVTSGGKRLSPKTVNGNGTNNSGWSNYVDIAGTKYTTDEVLDDGGAYGESSNYVFWFDAQGEYQQYFPSGGTFLRISERPLHIKKINFSVETVQAGK